MACHEFWTNKAVVHADRRQTEPCKIAALQLQAQHVNMIIRINKTHPRVWQQTPLNPVTISAHPTWQSSGLWQSGMSCWTELYYPGHQHRLHFSPSLLFLRFSLLNISCQRFLRCQQVLQNETKMDSFKIRQKWIPFCLTFHSRLTTLPVESQEQF